MDWLEESGSDVSAFAPIALVVATVVVAAEIPSTSLWSVSKKSMGAGLPSCRSYPVFSHMAILLQMQCPRLKFWHFA
jgi:hypothetical protein